MVRHPSKVESSLPVVELLGLAWALPWPTLDLPLPGWCSRLFFFFVLFSSVVGFSFESGGLVGSWDGVGEGRSFCCWLTSRVHVYQKFGPQAHPKDLPPARAVFFSMLDTWACRPRPLLLSSSSSSSVPSRFPHRLGLTLPCVLPAGSGLCC